MAAPQETRGFQREPLLIPVLEIPEVTENGQTFYTVRDLILSTVEYNQTVAVWNKRTPYANQQYTPKDLAEIARAIDFTVDGTERYTTRQIRHEQIMQGELPDFHINTTVLKQQAEQLSQEKKIRTGWPAKQLLDERLHKERTAIMDLYRQFTQPTPMVR